MKNSNKIYFFIIVLAIIAITPSCKKYDDGPRVSLRSKKERVANTWTVDKLFRNGVQASDEEVQNYKTLYFNSLVFTKDGDATLNTSVGTFTGTWEFVNDKEGIYAIMTGKPLGSPVVLTNSKTFKILRLKEKELWLEFYDDLEGDTKKVYLIPA